MSVGCATQTSNDAFSFAENPQGTIYFSICCFFQVLSFAAIGLRLWGRKLQRIPLQVNDYAILAALVSAIRHHFAAEKTLAD